MFMSVNYYPSDGVSSVLSVNYYPSDGVISVLSVNYHLSGRVISIKSQSYISSAENNFPLLQTSISPANTIFQDLNISTCLCIYIIIAHDSPKAKKVKEYELGIFRVIDFLYFLGLNRNYNLYKF